MNVKTLNQINKVKNIIAELDYEAMQEIKTLVEKRYYEAYQEKE
jgi:hypothetical protein